MKKLFSILAFQFLLLLNVHAQGQGDIVVNNDLDCRICVDVWAVCSDGSHYSANVTYCVDPHTTSIIYNQFTGWAGTGSWSPSAPSFDCEWQWQGVKVKVDGTGNYNSLVNAPLEWAIGDYTTPYPLYDWADIIGGTPFNSNWQALNVSTDCVSAPQTKIWINWIYAAPDIHINAFQW